MDLFADDCDSDLKLTINEDYAKRYDRWRQGEELQKLKDKYGNDISAEESSTSEDEDEDAKELTEDIEKNFFKTLSCLKEKNPKIYDKNVRFFDSQPAQENEKKAEKKKAEPSMTLGEYQRKVLLEKKGKFSDDEEDDKTFQEMSNAEQEKALKESFKDVLEDSDNENEKEAWGGLFKKRIKTKEELKTEEEDYKLWLAGEKKKLKNSADEEEFKGLHDFWSDPKLDEGEKFLRDYILNKRFLEKDDKNRIPAYDELVQDLDLSGEENVLEEQEEFERKYNFRFEEPDQEFIKRYPRTLENSMRKKDDRRKKHREEVKARKEKEKVKKAEELKRLKALKRQEIMEKIKKLQEITGNENMGFQKNDLEDDFDPEEHDKRMSELFSEDYYGACNDEKKPENPELDEELEIENWDEWGGERNVKEEEEELHCEDPGFNMDCDYDPRNHKKLRNELIESSKKRKKRRQSKFSAAVAKEKPVFDPNDKTFEKYIDEYYSLDYEDLIGDLPCRFKYRKVVPNDYGLTIEEILAAPDKELNRWASVKKIMQRRPEHVELYDVKAYRNKAKDFDKKKKCLPSLYAEEHETEETTTENFEKNPSANKKLKKKNKETSTPVDCEVNTNMEGSNSPETQIKEGKKKKRKRKNKDSSLQVDSEAKRMKYENEYTTPPSSQSINENKKKKNKHKFNSKGKTNEESKNSQDQVYNISDSRLKSYGINPKKLKNKLKYGKKKE